MSPPSDFDIILDNSQQNLSQVPDQILQMTSLKMLYLEGNFIEELPDEFFPRLQNLTWLDLRNNRLGYIPENIAHHPNLENLLLSGNKLEVLPNEIGLVANLKVLQVGDNPLVYPSRKIVIQGTKALCAYLLKEYQKIQQVQNSDNNKSKLGDNIIEQLDKDDLRIMQEESEIAITDNFSTYPIKNNISSSLVVKGLSQQDIDQREITHKIEKDESKLSLRSYYNSNKYIKASTTQTSNHDVILQNALKKEWIDKLKNLLAEQERILQQEKNLEALTSWRLDKRLEKMRGVSNNQVSEVPYGTYKEYDIMLSRKDLNNQLDRIIKQSSSSHNNKGKDVQKMIDDLVSRLKDMESVYKETKSPRSEIEESGKQIMLIMDIHKKLLQLQETI